MSAETYRIEIPVTVIDSTEPGVSQADKKVSAFDKTVEKTQDRLEKMNRTKFQVAVDAVDKASSIVEKIKSGVQGLTSKAWSVTMHVKDMATAPIRGIFNLLKNPIVQAGAILGVSVGLKDTIDTFATFEATMSKVKAVSGATESEFEQLTAKAKEMGSTTKFTASEAGDAFTYMAMAGWDAGKMIDGIGGIMALSAADGLDLATTSDIVTDALTAFGMAASESGHLADVLAAASTSANTNVSMLGESFKYIAPLSGSMGYSIEDTALALGLMANASVKGSMAGTTLKTSIANLASPTKAMSEVMQKYGVSLTNTDGTMKSLKEVMDNVRDSFGDLGEAERAAAVSTLFGKQSMSGMLAIINASEKDYNDLTESIYNSNGAAQEMADIMLDNLAGAFTLLQSAAEGVKITLGDRLKPHLMSFTTWLTDKMPQIEVAVGRAMDAVDSKIEAVTKTIKEFTSSSEWQSADDWGKLKIAWDKLVADPFDEWWNSKGKGWMADKAAGIGQGLGSGLSNGIAAMLGLDIGSAASEGISIGASFSEGFANGFDGEKVKEAVKNALKGIFSDAGTLLPGKETSSTAWLSAGAIGLGLSKMGVFKALGGIGGGMMNMARNKSGGGIAGTAMSALGGSLSTMTLTAGTVYVNGSLANGLGNGSTGGKALAAGKAGGTVTLANGSTVASGGAVATGLAKAGVTLGSGATTAGGAALAGGGAIAGGVLGAVGLGSGIYDIYKGVKNDDKEEARKQKFSGGTKIGMVGAGAATGALVGSVVPVIGTGIGALVGAGVGGIAALTKGRSVGESLADKATESETKRLAARSRSESQPDDIRGSQALAYDGFNAVDFSKSKELHQTYKEIIDLDFAGTLDEQAEKYKTLDKLQSDTMSNAISDTMELKRQLDSLPTSKTVNIKIVDSADLGRLPGFSQSVTPHAFGGIMTKPHMGLVAEAGAESIIPLSPSKRTRGLELWEQTGKLLGVTPYADGGVPDMPAPVSVPVRTAAAPPQAQAPYINIEMMKEPVQIIIDGSGDKAEDIAETVKQQFGQLMDSMSSDLAHKLAAVFANMTV